jgi:hypothetical protein
VELRGFEPLTSAVQAPARVTGSSLLFLGGSSASRHLERFVGLYEIRGFACGGLISAQDHTRANGDCGVDRVNSITEGGEEVIEPVSQSADARLLARGNSFDGRLNLDE